ncbi:MAG: hypothetical protein JSW41_05080 [Candidatus Aenigmatarchaeota archaeon]|nr:MAG: hypothetical protein JSW41_05080 [Candidatus Aenigmarchaeota archaeon]
MAKIIIYFDLETRDLWDEVPEEDDGNKISIPPKGIEQKGEEDDEKEKIH